VILRSVAGGVAMALIFAACGPGAALQPLIEEDPAVFEIIDASPEVLLDDAPTLAARGLVRLLRARDFGTAWLALSSDAQRRVRESVGAGSDTPGSEVLKKALAAHGGTGAAEAVASVFGLDPKQLAPWSPEQIPAPPPATAGDGKASVYAYGASGEVRELRFVFDGAHWRLDTPALL
jgi:hypothetical protein